VSKDEPRSSPSLHARVAGYVFGVALLTCFSFMLYGAVPAIMESLCLKVGVECPPSYADAFRVGFLVVVAVVLVLASLEYWVRNP